MDQKDVIANGNDAAQEVWAMDTPILNDLSFKERFDYIATIRNGIYAQFPAPEDNPYEEIDRNKIPERHLAILHRLNNSLQLSEVYKDFIMTITKEAVEDFTSHVQTVDKLREWQKINVEDKISLVQEFHNAMINHAQMMFKKRKANFGLTSMLKPLTVTPFEEEPEIFEIDDSDDFIESTFNGYAALTHNEWPAVEAIGINTHERASFISAEEAIETIAHESAHILEGLLAYSFFHHAPFIPDDLIRDAKLLFHMHDSNAYTSARLHTMYENQTNEEIARDVGDFVKNKIQKTMQP